MTDGANDFWRRLLYRWFVQYNPLYLVSAMLVLGGMIMTSRGLATEGSLYGPLGVAAIAELYAVALIGGAALLTRIHQRRPAVMLAVLTALYQCDLTLHTETCVQLGTAGVVASVLWFALFGGKLAALAWAVKARLSWAAYAVAMVGAAALAYGPYVVDRGDPALSGELIAAVSVALVVLGSQARVSSTVELEPWAATVFQRTAGVIWGLFGTLFTLHVLFWASGHSIMLAFTLPALILLCAWRVRSEAVAWTLVATAMVFTMVVSGHNLCFVALLATAALTLRAFSRTEVTRPATATDERSPYRYGQVQCDPELMTTLEPISAAARARQLTGALFTFYLALWTYGSTSTATAWPAHKLAVDAIVLVLAIAIALRVRPRLSLLVPSLAAVHALAVSGLVPTPHTTLGWGSTSLVLGFALLLCALATNYRLRRLTVPDA